MCTEHGRPCRLSAGALVVILAGGWAFSRVERESARETGPPAFTVRGRLDDPLAITWTLDLAGCPVDPDVFRDAVMYAQASWAATGVVGFRAAAAGDAPDVVYAWRAVAHGTCTPFGVDTSVAHTGPVGPGTFVHLDAGRDWSERGDLSLFHTCLHETGHVLGLGHSPDPAAVMFATDDVVRERLSSSDLAGVHSLYGGGRERPGDLTIAHANKAGTGTPTACLRGVAPPATTAFAVFDTDGDGDDELLVWRTDTAGYGALTAYHFRAGPALDRTVGPLLGLAAPSSPTFFGVDANGERLMVTVIGEGRLRVLKFDDAGLLSARPVAPLRLGAALVDEDGDGLLDRPLPGDAALCRSDRIGDLDGDGVLELVSRRPSSD